MLTQVQPGIIGGRTSGEMERQAQGRGQGFFKPGLPPAQAEQIKALLDGGQVTHHAPALPQPVTYHLPTPPRRKRRRKIGTVVEKNRNSSYALNYQGVSVECSYFTSGLLYQTPTRNSAIFQHQSIRGMRLRTAG